MDPDIISQLREKGYRITTARRAVLSSLLESSGPSHRRSGGPLGEGDEPRRRHLDGVPDPRSLRGSRHRRARPPRPRPGRLPPRQDAPAPGLRGVRRGDRRARRRARRARPRAPRAATASRSDPVTSRSWATARDTPRIRRREERPWTTESTTTTHPTPMNTSTINPCTRTRTDSTITTTSSTNTNTSTRARPTSMSTRTCTRPGSRATTATTTIDHAVATTVHGAVSAEITTWLR